VPVKCPPEVEKPNATRRHCEALAAASSHRHHLAREASSRFCDQVKRVDPAIARFGIDDRPYRPFVRRPRWRQALHQMFDPDAASAVAKQTHRRPLVDRRTVPMSGFDRGDCLRREWRIEHWRAREGAANGFNDETVLAETRSHEEE
jgi:hypothetical protein